MLEKRRVLLQFVGYLVNDESAVQRESVIGFLKERPFLLDRENAEWNTRKDVIALGETAPLQLIG